MTTKRWDELLVAEHEMIERAMAVLREELGRLATGKPASLRLQRATDFLLHFGDRVHNVKEEKVLFPLMGERGIPVEGGPIAVMLAEHEDERELLQAMIDALPTLASASASEVEQLVERGEAYLDVRAEHIWKENDVLYPMGRRALDESDNEQLVAEFSRMDEALYGAQAPAKLAAMLEEAERGEERKKLLVESLSYEQIHAVMEALPFEVTFVDADDTVAYFNRLDKEKVFVRTRSVIGRKVLACHPRHSADKVERIVDGFKAGTLDEAEFWIDFKGDKVLIRYFPVRSDSGEYMGVLEVTQEIGAIQRIEGQKRLLDE